MNDLAVAFSLEDVELKEALISNFGKEVSFVESKGFDGSEIIHVAFIPVIALTVQIIDFFITHFTKSKDKKDANREADKFPEKEIGENIGNADIRRVVVHEGKFISLEGFNADEVSKILKECLHEDE